MQTAPLYNMCVTLHLLLTTLVKGICLPPQLQLNNILTGMCYVHTTCVHTYIPTTVTLLLNHTHVYINHNIHTCTCTYQPHTCTYQPHTHTYITTLPPYLSWFCAMVASRWLSSVPAISSCCCLSLREISSSSL